MSRGWRVAIVVSTMLAVATGVQTVRPLAAFADASSYEGVVRAAAPQVFYPFDDSEHATTFSNVMHPGDDAVAVGGAHTVLGLNPFSTSTSDGSLLFSSLGPQYAQTPALGPLNGDNDRTVEFWFQTFTPGPQCLVSAGTQAHGAAMSICLTDGNQNASPIPGSAGVYVQFYDGDVYVPTPGLTDGSWHYLAVTLTGSTVSVVVDGSTGSGYVWNGSSYSASMGQPFLLPLTPQTAATPMQIGGPQGWAPAVLGHIDELAVYSTALTSADLSSHYSAGVAPPVTSPSLALSLTGPASLTAVPGGYSPSPFTITATLKNVGTATAIASSLTISLPSGLSLISGESASHLAGDLTPGTTAQTSWQVAPAPQSAATSLTYSVTAAATNASPQLMSKSVSIPAFIELYHEFRNLAAVRCLDADRATLNANWTKVQLWDCWRGANQNWELLANGTIVNQSSGRCLTAETGARNVDGATADLWTCNRRSGQQWLIESNGAIQNVASGRCLDANGGTIDKDGTKVQLWDCNGGRNQSWYQGTEQALPKKTTASVCEDRPPGWSIGNGLCLTAVFRYDGTSAATDSTSGSCTDLSWTLVLESGQWQCDPVSTSHTWDVATGSTIASAKADVEKSHATVGIQGSPGLCYNDYYHVSVSIGASPNGVTFQNINEDLYSSIFNTC